MSPCKSLPYARFGNLGKASQAETPIRVWYAAASKAEWKSPEDVKRQFGATIDFVGDNRIIFDLSGNKYRLIVHVC